MHFAVELDTWTLLQLKQLGVPVTMFSIWNTRMKCQHSGHLMWRTDTCEKDPDAGKDWRQEEKGTTEDEMVGWQHQLNGHEFE